jgi:hypothetical protein
MFFPVSDWFPAFVLTLAVELPIVAIVLRPVEPWLVRRVAAVVYANLASHLAVWYVLTQLFELGSAAYLLAAEGWAIAAETAFYALVLRGVSPRRAAVAAVVANGASFAVGRVSRLWLGDMP